MTEWSITAHYVTNRARPMIREEKPYRECPNCGEYKFRKIQENRITDQGGWFKPAEYEWQDEGEKCKHCKLEK